MYKVRRVSRAQMIEALATGEPWHRVAARLGISCPRNTRRTAKDLGLRHRNLPVFGHRLVVIEAIKA